MLESIPSAARGDLDVAILSLVSHELQTPVAIIKGYADTLLRKDVRWDEATIERSLSAISDECSRLQRLIGNLLSASALQAGTMPLHRVTTDLAGLVARAVRRLDGGLAGGRIRLEMASDLRPVLADAERVEEVLYNLVDNAVKYAPPDEPIRIEVGGQPDGIVVSVIDRGPGIASQDRPLLFERFTRALSARRGPGTGLGLFICRAIVEAHGGRIWLADPSPDGGSHFIFTLPYASEEEQHAG